MAQKIYTDPQEALALMETIRDSELEESSDEGEEDVIEKIINSDDSDLDSDYLPPEGDFEEILLEDVRQIENDKPNSKKSILF